MRHLGALSFLGSKIWLYIGQASLFFEQSHHSESQCVLAPIDGPGAGDLGWAVAGSISTRRPVACVSARQALFVQRWAVGG